MSMPAIQAESQAAWSATSRVRARRAARVMGAPRRHRFLDGVEGRAGQPHQVVQTGGAPGNVLGGEGSEAGVAERGEVGSAEPDAEAREAEVERGLGGGEGVQRLAEERETVRGRDDGPRA